MGKIWRAGTRVNERATVAGVFKMTLRSVEREVSIASLWELGLLGVVFGAGTASVDMCVRVCVCARSSLQIAPLHIVTKGYRVFQDRSR